MDRAELLQHLELLELVVLMDQVEQQVHLVRLQAVEHQAVQVHLVQQEVLV
jgi:hypothetical protein